MIEINYFTLLIPFYPPLRRCYLLFNLTLIINIYLYISAKQELAEVYVSQNFLKVYNQKIIKFFFEIWRSV